MSGAQENGAGRTIATLEGVTITQRWGDRKQFQRRVEDYAEREGLAVGFVIPMPERK